MATYTDPFGVGSPAYGLASNVASSNQAAIGQDEALASQINAANQAAQTQANQARLGPTGVATQNQLSQNALAESQGLLDPSTLQMLQQSIAQRGISSGMGVDSPNLSAAYLRALGLDINTQEELGQQNYLALLAANPSAPIFDVSQLLTSPGTYAQLANGTPTTDPTTGAINPGTGTTSPTTGTGDTSPTGTTAPASTGGLRINPSPVVQPTPAQANTVGGGGYPTRGAAAPYDPFSDTALASGDTSWMDSYAPYDPFSDAALSGGDTSWMDTYDPSGIPANTAYNPTTDQSAYTYGLPGYDTSTPYDPFADTAFAGGDTSWMDEGG